MIISPLAVLKSITDAAEKAYPEEACGLLVGRRHRRNTLIETAIESANVTTGSKTKRFEVDPKTRFDVMRAVDGSAQSIIGLYHSHPDYPSEPSETDKQMIFEPDLIWLIVSVITGQAVHIGAFRPVEGAAQFRRLSLRTKA